MPTGCIQNLCLQMRSQLYSHAPPETAVVAKMLTGLKQKYGGSGACSGLRELTNQSRESGLIDGALRQRVNRRTAVMGTVTKITCFLNIKECKHSLDGNQNKISNFKLA